MFRRKRVCITCVAWDCPHLEADGFLSQREVEVVELVAEGLTNKIIAFRMALQVGSIKQYVSYIMRKLKVENRTGIAVWWAENRDKLKKVEG